MLAIYIIKKSKDIFQDYVPNNICFGCGNNTKDGLHIKSYWQGEMAECVDENYSSGMEDMKTEEF